MMSMILYMAIGYEDITESCIKGWPRSYYDEIAVSMGLKPKDYKNKIEIHKALGVELPYYLTKNPDVKKFLKEQLQGSENHYLYDMVNMRE